MTDSAGRRAWLALACTPGIGAVLGARLIERFRTPQAVLAASQAQLADAGLPAPARRALGAPDAAAIDAACAWLDGDDRHFVTAGDSRYPQALAGLDAPPPWLYALGDTDLLARPAIAIVGSRNPSGVGAETARAFAAELAAAGLVVVSGLAQGIDAAAHRGALEANGMTIAVCGTGLDQVYPRSNKALAERIAASGALVSEFALGTGPARGNFPRRNRVIAGLCRATLVVEAARASGSLITARLAGEAGRDVFAIPGSIHNPLARGCHQLLRDGARLVETTGQILEDIAPGLVAPAPRDDSVAAAGAPGAADQAQQTLAAALGHAPARVDELVARTGWSADAVSSTLLIMELEGRVVATHGGAYMPTGSGSE